MLKQDERLYEEKNNNQGCLMKIVKYNHTSDIVVEFQDEYKFRTSTTYHNFKSGSVKNPYYPSVYGVGMIGVKYPRSVKCKNIREYDIWNNILERSYSPKYKKRQPSYTEVSCCKEWLSYENFYEWLHSQPNFDKWSSGERWAIDKDILKKGNKIYCPDNCCLVPQSVNCLFLKREAERGDLPIGVKKNGKLFEATSSNPLAGRKIEKLGKYETIEEAFQAYKKYRENLIKQVAQIEFNNGNIIKECYEAMMNYKVEITD